MNEATVRTPRMPAELVRKGAVPAAFLAALASRPTASAHVYDGQEHAFARVGGQHYNADAATLANAARAHALEHAAAHGEAFAMAVLGHI